MTKQMKLTALWWIWGTVLIFMLVFLSMQPALFGEDTAKVWQWFLPNIIPTMTMVGASAYASQQTLVPQSNEAGFLIVVVASAIYLSLLTLSVISTPFVAQPLQALQQANLWLGPVQGLAASGLAIYFIKR